MLSSRDLAVDHTDKAPSPCGVIGHRGKQKKVNKSNYILVSAQRGKTQDMNEIENTGGNDSCWTGRHSLGHKVS